MDNKLTDEQIKKALEYCVNGCDKDCPLYYLPIGVTCERILHSLTLGFLNRLQTENEKWKRDFNTIDMECERLEKAEREKDKEIERLKNHIETLVKMKKCIGVKKEVEAEAIKGVLGKVEIALADHFGNGFYKMRCKDVIDNIVEEMKLEY